MGDVEGGHGFAGQEHSFCPYCCLLMPESKELIFLKKKTLKL